MVLTHKIAAKILHFFELLYDEKGIKYDEKSYLMQKKHLKSAFLYVKEAFLCLFLLRN